jgi:probable HAF family extracellular repeat protein
MPPDLKAVATVPRGISSDGTIVGQYTAAGLTHAFTYRDGSFTNPIDVPASMFDNLGSPKVTLGVGISPQGDLVGCFHEDGITMTTMHGWLLRNGEFIKLITPQFPGDTSHTDPDTMNNGISPNGEIVGFYLSRGVSYIADEDGIATTFTVDGNLFTLAQGVNARGDIVGVYGTNQADTLGFPAAPSGFLRTREGNYRGFVVRGASNTQPFGINSAGDIVGQYTDGTGTHGLVFRVTQRRP